MARRIILTAALLLGHALGAAAEPGKIGVEFNSLQAAEKGCRAVFVLHNGLDAALEKFALRIVAFDTGGRAALFLSLDIGAMPADKTRVVRFDLGEALSCSDIGRLVLDDVIACAGGGLDAAACLSRLSLSSRAGVPLDD